MRIFFEVWMPVTKQGKFLFAVPIITQGEVDWFCCHECALDGIRIMIRNKLNPSNCETAAFANTMFTIIIRDL